MTSRQWLAADAVLVPDAYGVPALQPAAIAIVGATIEAVRLDLDAARASARERGEPWREAPGQLITPAFINAHTHLAMVCFRGLRVEASTAKNVVEDLFYHVEQRITDDDIAAFARQGAYESLLHGVGLVWDHYYGAQALAAAIASTGLTAVVAPTLADLSGPGVADLDRQLDATVALSAPAWAERGIWSAVGPHASDTVSASLWGTVRDLATRHTLPVHAHLSQSLEELQRCVARHNTTPLRWLQSLGLLEADIPHALWVHGLYLQDDELDLLDPRRHTLGFCPYSQLIYCHMADAITWQAKGLRFIAATDCAASNDSMNVQKELRQLSGLRTAEIAFDADQRRFWRGGDLADAERAGATRRALHDAREALVDPNVLLSKVFEVPGQLHPAFTAGVIAPGALANLIIWEREHPAFWPGLHPLRTLALGDTTQAIHQMMVAGRWIGEAGDYHRSLMTSPDYLASRREASERFEALRARL